MGSNWHEMYLWLLSREIRPYHDRTFISMLNGIVEVQNRSLGGHFPKWPSHCAKFESTIAYFFHFSMIVLSKPRPGIRYEVLPLACEGMWQSTVAGLVGLTCATVNRILVTHAATGTLVPGKSTGSHRKTTPYQDRALLRMVQQDRFIGARALTARMGNLYAMEAGRKTIKNWLCSIVIVHIDLQGSPCWLPTTTVSIWSGHRGGRNWQWPIGSMSSLVMSPDSNFTW